MKKIKSSWNGTVGGALAVALCAVSFAVAQEKVEDDALMELLDMVDQEQVAAETPVVTELSAPVIDASVVELTVSNGPAAQVEDVLEASVERVEETDAVFDTLETEEEGKASSINDLDMNTYEPDEASSEGSLISVRLNKVGLGEAISLFAQLSGANIIVPELAEASQISVNLKDVEWRPALQAILDTYNYELYQRVSDSNVYSVRRRPVGTPEPQMVETFLLKYATVPNVAELIRGLLPPDAKVSEFASRNMIVVKSTESSISEVRSVLEVIDIVRQQVFIESKFMELSDDAQKDLGVDWSVLEAYSAGTLGATEKSYVDTKTDGTQRNRFTDAAGNKYAEGSGFSVPGSLGPLTPVYEGLTPSVLKTDDDSSSKVFTSVLSADEFRVAVSALENLKGVNTVSNPKIIVANEEMANISIVRKEPNLKQERQQSMNDTADTITFSLDPLEPFFKFGIELDVTPSINTSSNITVKINPSLTRKYDDKPAGDNTYPIIDAKTIKTVFNLASGQTAAIGGLTEATDSEEERKVPVLGSIPFLGRLFSWKQTMSGQSETIIFVTVGLANTQELTTELGLPDDSELARRRVIKDRNDKVLREQDRSYFSAEEEDRLEDMLKGMKEKEDNRLELRIRALEKELEKSAKQTKVVSAK